MQYFFHICMGKKKFMPVPVIDKKYPKNHFFLLWHEFYFNSMLNTKIQRFWLLVMSIRKCLLLENNLARAPEQKLKNSSENFEKNASKMFRRK